MKANLYSDGELIGHCDGVNNDTSVIIYRFEYYVFNANLKGFERCHAQRISRIEYTPREITTKEPLLPLE